MADSVYISKYLNQEQLEFVQMLAESETLYFKRDSIEDDTPNRYANLSEILENLVDKKMLNRVEKGKYAIPQFNDTSVLASFISNGGVISYWSALHEHGLTDRFPNKIFVKIPQRKRNTTLLGTPVQFVSVNPRKCELGVQTQGFGDRSFPITDVEMTLIDCFDQPRYAGDYPDLIRAFAQAKLNSKKLKEYTQQHGNHVIIRRMGYLAELLNRKELGSFIRFAKKDLGKKYSLFIPGGNEEGEFRSDWKLRLNLSEEKILELVENSL